MKMAIREVAFVGAEAAAFVLEAQRADKADIKHISPGLFAVAHLLPPPKLALEFSTRRLAHHAEPMHNVVRPLPLVFVTCYLPIRGVSGEGATT